ncbi:hypothetical protein [Arthrobacter sp. SPG23]|uniref:hypothetical protein n=1 Tax=Arthrobacter sp. SPG23 TaxID=1610703 RepID=UPI0011864E4D|nr:hypothetical protein [Arthrobacter sp. SPG23]
MVDGQGSCSQTSTARPADQRRRAGRPWPIPGRSGAAAGRALLLFTSLGHVLLGIILVLSERRLWASAIAEALLPAVIAVLLLAT